MTEMTRRIYLRAPPESQPKTPGWRAGVKPRCREAVRHSRGALRATTDPVRLNADGEIRIEIPIRLFS
jgi:hypothetical protein